MPDSFLGTPNILAIYLQIAQYPILARQIRRRMREELYRRGVITPERFEQEVSEKAQLSQIREGLPDVLLGMEEYTGRWHERVLQIRDHLTDFYFAYNLPLDLFHSIIEEVLAVRAVRPDEMALTFNPELAPLDFLLKQAERYEGLPEEQRAKVIHHLEEVIVVLTKMMISDQLTFVGVAKSWLTADDFKFIQSRRIGAGKIGGKAGGILLAWKILRATIPEVAQQIILPRSYFVGADVFYDFLSLHGLEFIDQKYKTQEQIEAEYPRIQESYVRSRFPEEVATGLRNILREVGKTPLVVRSSSLLEDSFSTSFAGKYASYFCPNQGTLKENLRDLTVAIRRIYASVYSPDALLYRRRMGLIDYDERMAILVQEVQGQTYRQYFFPTVAGVAYSHSPIAWSTRLRREEGFVRLVLGLGSRASERIGDDYPRLVSLSHPLLRTEISPAAIRRFSQHFVDVIDLEGNALTTLPVRRLLDLDYPPLRWVASINQGDTVLPLFSLGPQVVPDRLVLTFDNLLQHSDFVAVLKSVLSTLAEQYQSPVDIEFAACLTPDSPKPRLTFHLLQCRPQINIRDEIVRRIPANLPASDKLFLGTRMVPRGRVSQVRYILLVDPVAYSQVADPVRRKEVARVVGRLNKKLEKQEFIIIGPSRWGSVNIDLGVPVGYADIYNARALVELAVRQQGLTPEPSYGTHFFQALTEARIYPLALFPDDPDEYLNRDFIRGATNQLTTLLPEAAAFSDLIKVIDVPAEREGRRLEILMDGEQALAYFAPAENASA